MVAIGRQDCRRLDRILRLGHAVDRCTEGFRRHRPVQSTSLTQFPALSCGVDVLQSLPYALTTALLAVLEAMSDQNDNLILPMFGWTVGILLDV